MKSLDLSYEKKLAATHSIGVVWLASGIDVSFMHSFSNISNVSAQQKVPFSVWLSWYYKAYQ